MVHGAGAIQDGIPYGIRILDGIQIPDGMSTRYSVPMAERMTRTQQQQVTRTRLLDAAETLFGERGIHSTSLDEVAKQAGLTKGAIYANFTSKNDLVAAILERKLTPRNEPPPPDASLTVWLNSLGENYESSIDQPNNRRFVQAFVEFWLYGTRDDSIHTVLSQWLQTVRDSHATHAAALAGDDLPIPPRQFAALILALDIGIGLQRLVDPDAVPAQLFTTGLNAVLHYKPPPSEPAGTEPRNVQA